MAKLAEGPAFSATEPDSPIWNGLGEFNPVKLASRLRAAFGKEALPPNVPAGARHMFSGVPGGGAVIIGALGVALGLGATELVVARGWDPGGVAVGAWVARPQVGSMAIDPYARADLARSGELPLATAEGLTFTATTDDTGYRLVRNCVYLITGAAPAARFWTLTASGADGRVIDDPAHRSAFTSTDVVRDLDGRFTVAVAPTARPGNWLPVTGVGPLTLSLRLYDTPLAGNSGEAAQASLPSITRRSCSASAGGASAGAETVK